MAHDQLAIVPVSAGRSPTRQQQREIDFLTRSRELSPLERLVLLIFVTTCEHWEKLYCWPSIGTILLRLKVWYHFPSSRRSVDRAISRLRRLGLISRQLRTRPIEQGKRAFTSSLTYLKGKLRDLIGKGARLSKSLAQCFRAPTLAHYSFNHGKKSGWGPPSKAPPPVQGRGEGGPPGTFGGISSPTLDENLLQLRTLLKNIG